MKRLSYLLIIITLLTYPLIGCNQQMNEEELQSAFNGKITSTYEAMNKLSKFEITYDDYMKLMKENFVDEHYFDEELIYAYNGETYYVKDLKNVKLEELKAKAEKLMANENSPFANMSTDIKLSKVYEDQKYKYVFEKSVANTTDKIEHRNHFTKKYRFKLVDGEWKIFSIEAADLHWYDGKEKLGGTEEGNLKKLPYQIFDNQPVEYIENYHYDELMPVNQLR